MSAVQRWADALASWAIPPEILARAPESPWTLPPALFRAGDDARDTPSRRSALEALSERGVVLDVGCGAGAAAFALAGSASKVVGIDESEAMLAAFRADAAHRGIPASSVLGRWPDVAAAAEIADVVLCHHVFYNVPDLDRFARALSSHAHRRVVVEITSEHPRAWQNPLWQALHGIDRPTSPTADSAIDVLSEAGIVANAEQWDVDFPFDPASDDAIAFLRRGLCLPADRDADVRRALAEHPPPQRRTMVTLWWDV